MVVQRLFHQDFDCLADVFAVILGGNTRLGRHKLMITICGHVARDVIGQLVRNQIVGVRINKYA